MGERRRRRRSLPDRISHRIHILSLLSFPFLSLSLFHFRRAIAVSIKRLSLTHPPFPPPPSFFLEDYRRSHTHNPESLAFILRFSDFWNGRKELGSLQTRNCIHFPSITRPALYSRTTYTYSTPSLNVVLIAPNRPSSSSLSPPISLSPSLYTHSDACLPSLQF